VSRERETPRTRQGAAGTVATCSDPASLQARALRNEQDAGARARVECSDAQKMATADSVEAAGTTPRTERIRYSSRSCAVVLSTMVALPARFPSEEKRAARPQCGVEPRGPAVKPVTGAAVCAWRGVWALRLSPVRRRRGTYSAMNRNRWRLRKIRTAWRRVDSVTPARSWMNGECGRTLASDSF
jgi:hypothetical protein